MSTELIVSPHGEVMSADDFMPVLSVTHAIARRKAVIEFTRELMVEGVDYGKIPGTTKNTLLKPGAEKLNTMFGLVPRPTLVRVVEDWDGRDHNGEPFFNFVYRYGLYRGNNLVAEADGSCNSWEVKYRYRDAQRLCPTCGKPAIFKSKQGDGWFCWAKRDGCGANFKADDVRISSQPIGKIPNPDPADLHNTIMKMGQKRAYIASTLLALNASEFFTQDLEDFADTEPSSHHDESPAAAPVAQETPPPPPAPTETAQPPDKPAPKVPDPMNAARNSLQSSLVWLGKPTNVPVKDIPDCWKAANFAQIFLQSDLPKDDVALWTRLANNLENFIKAVQACGYANAAEFVEAINKALKLEITAVSDLTTGQWESVALWLKTGNVQQPQEVAGTETPETVTA